MLACKELLQRELKSLYGLDSITQARIEAVVSRFERTISKNGIENFINAVEHSEDSLWEENLVVLSWKNNQNFTFMGEDWMLSFCLNTEDNTIDIEGECLQFL